MQSTHWVRCVLLASSALATLGVPVAAFAQGAAGETSAASADRVVVTAQRREQLLQSVPLSVAAFQRGRIDQQGIRSIDDIARLTPGVTFGRADGRNAGASNIAIRGISSGVAASTTGIYIDDTPIQTRIIGAGASNFNTYPSVFDLERVEVLRGPQGTLFGAGSQGGTLRFITPQPSLSDYRVYGRGEVGSIDGGGMNYEGGVAVGGPLVDNKVGFRVSAWTRRDGGYVDRVNTDPLPGDVPFMVFNADPSQPPTVLPRRDRVNHTVDENANSQESTVLRGALLLQASDALSITGSVYYQNVEYNDSNTYWESLSNPGAGEYRSGAAMAQPSQDEFYLPSLNIAYDFGNVRLVSNTSYFDREQSAVNDYTLFESALWAGSWRYPVGMFAPTTQLNTQKTWTQEVRLEGSGWGARLDWVVGGFYQHSRQFSSQFVENRFLPDLINNVNPFGVGALGPGQPPIFLPPGMTVFDAMFNFTPLTDGLYTFAQEGVHATDEQYAAFGQADFHATDRLTFTVGLRYGETKFNARANYSGPVVGPAVSDSGDVSESPFTPKFGVSFQATPDNMLYASAAKGFRVGGYNPQVGLPCIAQLASLGYTPEPGNPTGRPVLFESDSLWSYEIGSKNTFAGGRAQVNASAYYIDWSNIQQGVALGQCGFLFTINAGSAVSQGFDLEGSLMLTDRLTVGTAIGFNHAEFQDTVFGGPGAAVSQISEGDRLPGSPWQVTLSGQYDFGLFSFPSFFRVDFEHRSKGPDNTPGLNLANRSPVLPPPDPMTFIPSPATNTVSARLGMNIGDATLSVFVRNLFNENPNLGRGDSAIRLPPAGFDTSNYTGMTLTPRTIGVTVVYRY